MKLRFVLSLVLFTGVIAGVAPSQTAAAAIQGNVPSYGAAPMPGCAPGECR